MVSDKQYYIGILGNQNVLAEFTDASFHLKKYVVNNMK